MSFRSRVSDKRRQNGVKTRTRVENAIRSFFLTRGFDEVRTPLLVESPGMEPYIRPIELKLEAGRAFLPTSPEFAMKKLLAGGLEKIFQMGPCFRLEPVSRTHFPEFTMLEWYEAHRNYFELMQTTEQMVEAVAMAVHGKPQFEFNGSEIDVRTPWKRITIEELFQEFAGHDLRRHPSWDGLNETCKRLRLTPEASINNDTWDDLFFKIWLNTIEPRLPQDRAVIVHRYPPPQAALSVLEQDSDGTRWARRFEVFIGGLELANAFEELRDPREQRERFVKDMQLRQQVFGDAFPPNPIDEEFISALEEGLPPTSGIALGVDRLIMLAANEPDIDRTFWLSPYLPSQAPL